MLGQQLVFYMFIVVVSLVISSKVGCSKLEIILCPLFITTDSSVELLVSEELGDLWTDDHTLFDVCCPDSWGFLSEIPKHFLCMIHSHNRILHYSQFDVQRRQQYVAGFYHWFILYFFLS